MAGRKGKSQPSTSPSVSPTAAAKAILKASAWTSPACSVSRVAASADIGQNGDEPNEDGSERVDDGVIGAKHDHVGLRAIAHALDIFVLVQIDPDREALRIADEPHRLADLR